MLVIVSSESDPGGGENPGIEIMHSLNNHELALAPSSPTALFHAATGQCLQTRRRSASGLWRAFCPFVGTIEIAHGSFRLGPLRKGSGAPGAPGETKHASFILIAS